MAEDLKSTPAVPPSSVSKRYITSDELKTHNHPKDLWISIQGKVYDVSTWLDSHPGGDLPLLSLAGHDVTDAFIAAHPGTAWKYLDRFFIGHLADYAPSEISKDYRKLHNEILKAGYFDNNGVYVYFSGFVMLFLIFLCFCGVLGTDNFWIHMLSAAMLGWVWITSGWIGHDSGHHQLLKNRSLNRFVQVLSGNCVTGISMGWWKRNHNTHHIACNSLEYDPDLQYIPLFAVSSKFFQSLFSYFYEREMTFNAVSRFLVCIQHWTFYPIMCVARVNLFAQTFLLLMSKKRVPHKGQEFLGIGFFWFWFPYLISALPNWPERVMFVLCAFAVTSIQHVQFCLNHFSSPVYVEKPTAKNWFEAQTNGTIDISCSPWMDWFHGGLQFQIEHHLFPRLPRCHLRKIAPAVKSLCLKHGLPYVKVSFFQANVLLIKTLRTAALEARDLKNPVAKNLVWEAVNTQG